MAQVKCSEFSKMVAKAVFQRDLTVLPASFYVGLGHGPLPSKTAILADINEIAGSGYARKQLAASLVGFPTIALVDGDWKVTSLVHQFAAIGDLNLSADFAFLCDVASGVVGRLFGAVSIPEPFRLLAQDTYDNIYEYLDK